MQPHQPVVPHPGRGGGHRIRVEIESSRANADHHRLHPAPVLGHPALLLGAAQPDKNNACAAGVHTFNRRRILGSACQQRETGEEVSGPDTHCPQLRSFLMRSSVTRSNLSLTLPQ